MKGRFAPSPTGVLHLGNLRTALLAWLFARSAGSSFLVRVEDLDEGRVRPGFAERQLADLRAIGLDWDGDVVWQSARTQLYAEALERLPVFECFCTRAEVAELLLRRAGLDAAVVEVLHAHDEARAGRAREQPREQRGAQVAEVERAGRARREAPIGVHARNGSSPAISASRGALRSRSEYRSSTSGHSMPTSGSSNRKPASVAGS